MIWSGIKSIFQEVSDVVLYTPYLALEKIFTSYEDRNRNLDTVLHLAARNGLSNLVRCVIRSSNNVNVPEEDGSTALHWAVRNKHLGTTDVLIEYGARVDSCDQRQFTPLFWAVCQGYQEITEVLIAKGANIHSLNIDKRTPLHLAVIFGHTSIIKSLIETGGDIYLQDKRGRSALDYADQQELKDLMIYTYQSRRFLINHLLKKKRDLIIGGHFIEMDKLVLSFLYKKIS